MTALIAELKTRARLRLNALRRGDGASLAAAHHTCARRRWPTPADWKLHQALNLVASEAGFDHWDHARRVLGGESAPGEDMGALWHSRRCDVLLNLWFADYRTARRCYDERQVAFLLPYRRQFVVVGVEYLQALGVVGDGVIDGSGERDLVRGYGGETWLGWGLRRLAAIRREIKRS